ncbi:hypothetical protein [Acinetobacter thermotolerans]|uniref:hypothetical protein n=1 Tax=Acinetobacter thermotolerans TaxID=3151487 RepID=UPI00325A4839
MMTTTAKADFYRSSTMQTLEDDALALVAGQGNSIQTATDPHGLEGLKVIEVLNQYSLHPLQGLNTLTSIFQRNSEGQLILQINQAVVSIGVIEFRLTFDGLSNMGESLAEQIKLF